MLRYTLPRLPLALKRAFYFALSNTFILRSINCTFRKREGVRERLVRVSLCIVQLVGLCTRNTKRSSCSLVRKPVASITSARFGLSYVHFGFAAKTVFFFYTHHVLVLPRNFAISLQDNSIRHWNKNVFTFLFYTRAFQFQRDPVKSNGNIWLLLGILVLGKSITLPRREYCEVTHYNGF